MENNRLARLIGLGAALVLFVGMWAGVWFWLELDVTVNPQAQLENAQTQWQSAEVNRYKAFVRVQETFSTSGVYEIVVENDTVVEAQLYDTGAYRYDPNATAFEIDTAQAARLTMDSLLNQVSRLTEELSFFNVYTPSTSHIVYNEVYGYPQRYIQNTCGIIANGSISTCIIEYEVLEFEILE